MRTDILAKLHHDATTLSNRDLEWAGPYIRKVVRRLRQGGDERGAEYRAMGLSPPPVPHPVVSAVGLVLALAALELAKGARSGAAGRAYDLFFREDEFSDGSLPDTLSEALVYALKEGEQKLVDVVANEVASVLGIPPANRKLIREVRRRIELFELLAYEGHRIQVG